VPVLITDPWLRGPAYFGSWTFSHQIPEEQMAAATGEFMRGRLRNVAKDVIRDRFSATSVPYRLARRAYHLIKSSPAS